MSDDRSRDNMDLPDGFGDPDLYTLEIPPDKYEDVRKKLSGKLVIEQTPEQRDSFLNWIQSYLEENGRSVETETDQEGHR